ncbi:MAG: gephyrin-like molybdotransferase Glp [Pirellulaceae bacterium]
MLSVERALQLVLAQARPLLPREVLAAESLGCVLAQAIVSDIDSPPHDKSIVDGYALFAASAEQPGVELAILEEVTAGAVPTRTVELGSATRIMTGAPIPAGADAVVMVEQTELASDRVRILQAPIRPGQNIIRRAASLVKGQTVLAAGKRLRGIEMGLLAEVGRTSIAVVPRPRLAVLATGNELVEPGQRPGPSQIRNSNGPLLQALAAEAGAVPVDLGIARDDPADLRVKIERGLAEDVLVLSGGVSAGVLDLVPQALAELGVEQVFHKVNLKPGKPLWFGVKRHDDGRQTLVFGLPGNPVSGLVCFELFVRSAIQALSGREPIGLPRVAAVLTCEHHQRGERPTYWPALLAGESVTPLAWQGSGDLRTLSEANCLAHFPAGDRVFHKGEFIFAFVFNG